jgi:hypothetical protein
MALVVTLNNVDITNIAVQGSWTRRLNRPSQAQIKIPSDQYAVASGFPGSRLLIKNNGVPVFHGLVLLVETDQGEDTGYITYNAQDPMELWQWRPVRADDCDFSKPAGSGETNGNDLFATYVTGPQIIEAALSNSIYCGAGPPANSEGPLFLELGDFEDYGCDLTGAPQDWPMTIAQLASLLISTGCLDLVITPIDNGFGDPNMGRVDGYNGDYGTDRSSSVVFEYGTGQFNMRSFRRVQDMTNLANKIWYYAGPRIETVADPAGDQHWCFNVTDDDPCLPDPIPNGQTKSALIHLRETVSQPLYGVRMDIQIFDAWDELFNCEPQPAPDCSDLGKYLYRNRWESESWIRAQPRDLVHVTPIRDAEIGTFDIGDLVGVEIPLIGVSAAQRVYAYTVSWDNDGVLALGELETSDTADEVSTQ